MSYALLNLVISSVALWFVLRAKPLGTMPYHWGTWVGMQGALGPVVITIGRITARTGANLDSTATAALYILALTSAVAGFGILRRRRFGVVVLVVCSYLLTLLIVPFFDTVPGQPDLIAVRERPLTGLISLPKVIAILSTVFYFVCTVIYFKRRWPLMNDKSIPG